MFICPLSTVCFFFYVPSHLYSLNVTLYTHTNVYVLSCCVSVLFEFCLTVMWLLSVTHAIHYTTSLHCLVCPCTSHTTVPVLHVTCMSTCIMQMSVLSSVMLIVCLDHATHALSLHTCTVLVYHTYMYTHSIHCLPVVHHVPLFVHCYKTENGSLVQVFHMHTVKRCYTRRAPFQWLPSR